MVPISSMIRNTSQHSSDYNNLRDIPRPSHADFTARIRYGDKVDMRGGGHFSARLTAPLCVAGGIALQLLREKALKLRPFKTSGNDPRCSYQHGSPRYESIS